jgi:hypothetical protein
MLHINAHVKPNLSGNTGLNDNALFSFLQILGRRGGEMRAFTLQKTFAHAEATATKRPSRREQFLARIERVIP